MRSSIFLLALITLAYGLWAHDWSLIVTSVVLIVVWPMLVEDLQKHKRERMIDRLWDDDDLSESA